MPSTGLMALQASLGNTAVVQMLRRAGHPGTREQDPRPDGRGHHHRAAAVARRSAVQDVLRTPGRPLDDATRTEMEARLGADFSDVHVHTDAAAKTSAAEVGARAYTAGSHVVMGEGGDDKHTLAHELTHVIQQRRGPVAGTGNGAGLKVSDPSDRFEREAEANATRVMNTGLTAADSVRRTKERPAARSVSAAGGPVVQRAAVLTDLDGGVTAGAFGPDEAKKSGAGTVAMVPALLDPALNLVDIAEKYDTGFTGGRAPRGPLRPGHRSEHPDLGSEGGGCRTDLVHPEGERVPQRLGRRPVPGRGHRVHLGQLRGQRSAERSEDHSLRRDQGQDHARLRRA